MNSDSYNIFQHQTPFKIFEFVLENYFRIHPPHNIERYSEIIFQASQFTREKLAKTSPYPEIVELLVHDVDPWVRDAVCKNPYWQLLGQFKPLLNMNGRDKIRFIEREGLASLLVFIVFERDVEILRAVFENPNVSIQMLALLRKYLTQRGEGENDANILKLVDTIITQKKERLLKIAAIHAETNSDEPLKALPRILKCLLDRDPVVVNAAQSAFKNFSRDEFEEWLFMPEPFDEVHQMSPLFFWHVLLILRNHFSQKETEQDAGSASPLKAPKPPPAIVNQIEQRMLTLLQSCANNLNDEDSFLTLVHAYLEPNPAITHLLNQILTIQELMMLISDESFPRQLAMEALNILKRHPSPNVRHELAETFVRLYEQARHKLREMEASITACFDVIATYLKEIQEAYPQLNSHHLENIYYIHDMVRQLLDIPEELYQRGFFPTSPTSVSQEEDYQKIRVFWRATIGQYLGRLKDLDETIQKLWMILLPDSISQMEFTAEIHTAIREIEIHFKKNVGCHLQIACNNCLKRTCAAERFLTQNDFFLVELSDFLEEKKIFSKEAVS